MPRAPTVQMSRAPLPQTPLSETLTPLVTPYQRSPFQRTMVPASPTAQTSPGPLPHTSRRICVVPAKWRVQVMPFHRWAALLPTSQMSRGPLPQMPRKLVAPAPAISTWLQAVPLQW